MNRDRLKSALSISLRASLTFGLLAYVVSRVGASTLVGEITSLPAEIASTVFLLSIFSVGLSAWKWNVLLRVQNINIPYRSALVYYYVGQFFNVFLPSVIGGDSVRIYYLYADSGEGVESVSSVVIERLLGLYSILLIVAAGTLLGDRLIPGNIRVIALFLSLLGLALIPAALFADPVRWLLERTLFEIELLKIGQHLEGTFSAIDEYRNAVPSLGIALGVSLMFRFILIAINYLIALGIGINIPIVYFIVFVPLVEFLLFLPISIQGFGVRESAYLYLFSTVGVPQAGAIALGLLVQIVLRILNNVVGGVIYVFWTRLSPST